MALDFDIKWANAGTTKGLASGRISFFDRVEMGTETETETE